MPKVKVLQHGEFHDVFWGEGWNNWSRVRIKWTPPAKPQFEHIKGFGLPWNVRIAVTKDLRLG